MPNNKRLIAAVLCALLAFASCSCSVQEPEEWADPLPARNYTALDNFFLCWASFTMHRIPHSEQPDPMLVCASNWDAAAGSDGEVSRVILNLYEGLDLIAFASLGYITRVTITYSASEEASNQSEEYFVTACESTIYALGRDDIASDPQTAFVQLASDLEADSRIRTEGKTPTASLDYNGLALNLTATEDQTALSFEARIAPHRMP